MSIADDRDTFLGPQEIRIRLQQMRRGRSFYDDRRITTVDTIVRNCHDMADIQGLSGEDRYTVMTWHLMHMAARLEAQLLEDVMIRQISGTTQHPENKNSNKEFGV